MAKVVFFETNRTGYAVNQVGATATIQEIIDLLTELGEQYGFDTECYYKNDNGYTYGSINLDSWYDEYNSINIGDENEG